MELHSKTVFPIYDCNLDETVTAIKNHKKIVKTIYPNATFKARGRGNRVEAFKKTGRYHSRHADLNDVYLGQPEAKYMSHFVLYTYLPD